MICKKMEKREAYAYLREKGVSRPEALAEEEVFVKMKGCVVSVGERHPRIDHEIWYDEEPFVESFQAFRDYNRRHNGPKRILDIAEDPFGRPRLLCLDRPGKDVPVYSLVYKHRAHVTGDEIYLQKGDLPALNAILAQQQEEYETQLRVYWSKYSTKARGFACAR